MRVGRFNTKGFGVTDRTDEKKCLPNKLLGKSTKTAMLMTTTKSLCVLKKNTTTNLNVAHIDQIVLNDGINNEI